VCLLLDWIFACGITLLICFDLACTYLELNRNKIDIVYVKDRFIVELKLCY
jgi:hypothetical protein